MVIESELVTDGKTIIFSTITTTRPRFGPKPKRRFALAQLFESSVVVYLGQKQKHRTIHGRWPSHRKSCGPEGRGRLCTCGASTMGDVDPIRTHGV
jgi:hypothetical protein